MMDEIILKKQINRYDNGAILFKRKAIGFYST